jgi:hypothetical protein
VARGDLGAGPLSSAPLRVSSAGAGRDLVPAGGTVRPAFGCVCEVSAAHPEPRLISAGPSGKLGARGARLGGAAGATSVPCGTSSFAPPFLFLFVLPPAAGSAHFPKAELE